MRLLIELALSIRVMHDTLSARQCARRLGESYLLVISGADWLGLPSNVIAFRQTLQASVPPLPALQPTASRPRVLAAACPAS